MDSDELTIVNKRTFLRAFLCALCEMLLRPPTMFVENLGTVCQWCMSKRDGRVGDLKVSLNSQMDYLLQSLRVPCEFRPFGCRDSFTYEQLDRHQEVCGFRLVGCPVESLPYCEWKGALVQLEAHIFCSHEASFLRTQDGKVSFELSLDCDLSFHAQKVVVHRGGLNFVHFGSSEDGNDLCFGLHRLCLAAAPTDREFKVGVKLSGGKGQYKVFVDGEGGDDRYLDGRSGVKNHYMSLALVRDMVTGRELRLGVTLKWPVRKRPEVVTLPVSVIDELGDKAKCDQCKSWLWSAEIVNSIFVCYFGHCVCVSCTKFRVCPVCAYTTAQQNEMRPDHGMNRILAKLNKLPKLYAKADQLEVN